jgi:glycosyltransferase involved in cell wall biosynthesis
VPEEAVPVDLAQRAALFHSFVGPIPPEVRQNPRMGAFLTVHDLIPILQPQYSWPPWNAYIERSFASIQARNPGDHVFAVSQTVKEEFCAHTGFPEDRITVTPHAADPTLFYPCHGKEMEQAIRQHLDLGEQPYFLTLCQFAPRKNLPGLIEAFSLAIRDPSLRDHRLVLAGRCVPEEQGRLLALARSHGVESRLIITGFVPDESLAPLYSHASAFVFPTFAEGFGLPAVEAMQCGCPLVCSDLRVLREVAGDAAIYADPHRPEDIARALVDVIDPATHDHLQIKGQTRSSCFSWKKTADQIVQTYFQILKTVGVP